MENLKRMKESLTQCVEGQIFGNIEKVDAKELGEAVDMIKDLAEAIYYCTITEAMEQEEKNGEKEGKGQHGSRYYRDSMMPMYRNSYPIEYYDPRYRMDYSMQGGNRNYEEGRMTAGEGHAQAMRGYRDGMIIYPYEQEMEDPHAGHSWKRRKMYMKGKQQGRDKTQQMRELEQYMQELSSDLTEMISDASMEEKQMLQQKLNMLAAKIK